MRAILLAGGAGTRLREVVQNVPKPMAPIEGRPFLSYLLDMLEARGISEIVISVGYLGQFIINTYGDSYGAISIRYAVEDMPLGTGGGIRNALAQTSGFPVFVLNADTFLDLDYLAMQREFERTNIALGLAVRPVSDSGRYGQAAVQDNRILAFEPGGQGRASLINAGVYIFASDFLENYNLPLKFSFEKDFLESYVGQVRPFAFTTHGYFIDIGVPEDYARAQYELPKTLRELKGCEYLLKPK